MPCSPVVNDISELVATSSSRRRNWQQLPDGGPRVVVFRSPSIERPQSVSARAEAPVSATGRGAGRSAQSPPRCARTLKDVWPALQPVVDTANFRTALANRAVRH